MRKSTKQKLTKKPNITITIQREGKKPDVIKNPEAYILFTMLKKPNDKTKKPGDEMGMCQLAGEGGDILFSLLETLEYVSENLGIEEVQRVITLFFMNHLDEVLMLSKLHQLNEEDADRIVN